MADNGIIETARERETFKYDSILIANSVRNDTANPISSFALRSCSDPALTALAQVAVLRLGASRALISLFDSQHQHIIAETTPTLAITASSESPTYGPERLWLCGTAIPRASGICEYVLTPPELDLTTQQPSTGKPPVTVVPDVAEHAIFRKKAYCQGWPQYRFYAGVPIQSRRGISIGVFSVFDEKPRPGLDDASIQLLQDISRAILGHLEVRRSGDGRRPAERMVRGLGSYVEGKATMSGWQDSSSQAFDTNPATEEGSLNAEQQDLQRHQGDLAPITTINFTEPERSNPPAEFFVLSSPNETSASTKIGLGGDPRPIPVGDQPRQVQLRRIFSKAANILRESIEVEGVLFLDASIASFAGLVGSGNLPRHLAVKRRPSSSSSSSTYSESFNVSPGSFGNPDIAPPTCSVLGFSTSMSSSINDEDPTARSQSLPERHLQRLIRRYPKGKIFNFDQHGVMSSSGRSGEDVGPASAPGSGYDKEASDQDKSPRRPRDLFSRKNEGKAIADLFPGARSVAFVPLWDSNRQRWCSGCFVYTMTPTRIFTVQGELSYLSAFGAVIMADVATMDSSIVSTASSSLLSSLSHELRSPLHGIVLCAELLRDTSLDVFQGDVLRSVEVCGRTLLDTINHLLDWSMINNFIKSPKETPNPLARPPRRGVHSPRKNSVADGMMSITSDLDVDMLVEEIVECVHAGHTYQEESMLRFRNRESLGDIDAYPHARLDSIDAAENLGVLGSINSKAQLDPDRVVVILDIDPTVDWTFRAQPGAVRRIIMNLCGNSLKYTTRGFVKVSACQEPVSYGATRDRIVRIDIIDTGPGISQDYLNHRLFTPFAQEDTHTTGAGLGLSLVRKFVRALGGSIHLQSMVGEGTRVTVKLPLQISSLEATETAAEHDEFRAQVIELSRLRVAVMGFSPSQSGLDGSHWDFKEFDEQSSLEKICQDWLRMQVVASDERAEFLPDLILCDEHHLGPLTAKPRNEASSPVIVVCRSVAAARQMEKSHKSLQKLNGGLFSFISRPIGPRKLAKALVLSFRRWAKLQASAAEVSSISTILDRLPLPLEVSETTNTSAEKADDIEKPQIGAQKPEEVNTPKPPAQEKRQEPRGPRFLLVEDNIINMRILQAFMKKLGHVYDAATDGRQAVNSYKDGGGRYRCILMDISMPVMDGFEATRLIRGFEKEKRLPRCHIFAISGLASKEAQEDAFATGLDLFLSKPVQLKELSRILKSHGIV
ncbi:hypothetical protein CEP54_012793 [Fusarium duplospermum]|uniref:Histidine kinase n=1 Tax=Fusarium duplospermum TaxID=1325734 RepID=A0A428P6R2_9HYPO|nr:hypothetical protein CEP54_012793 [Fusarium duplospermum]